MNFSSIPYLYYFFPAVLAIYFLVPEKWRNGVLLLFSLVFYAWGEPKYVLLMLFAIVLFFLCGILMTKAGSEKQKKGILTFSVIAGVVMLGIFKYADFFVENWNAVTGANVPLWHLALPVGISFYLFQCISYMEDVYRGDARAQRNIISFGAYISLFPQLIAGPIVRYADIDEQLRSRKAGWEELSTGAQRFIMGLGKKVLIANQLGALVSSYRASNEKTVLFAWLFAVAYTLQIYFDFSGYSDMAIGLGRMFGFRFIENFRYPFCADSITDFWRRWHISLGSWFRDYVYIPLGGNRVSKIKHLRNILAVWLLTGLWHGAAWNFVLWGLLFAVALLIEKWIPAIRKLPVAIRRVYVLILVIFSFVLFRADTLAEAVGDMAAMVGIAGLPMVNTVSLYYLRSFAILILAGCIGSTPLAKTVAEKLSDTTVFRILRPVVLVLILLLCTAYLVDGSFNPFLYFRF